MDDAAGAEVAAQHLVNLGHRRVAYVGLRARPVRPAQLGPQADRLPRGDGGGPGTRPRPARDLTAREGDGEDVVGQLLGAPRPPTALLVESDDLAMRVLAALWRVGLRTPQDLSVVGFDGHAMAETFGLTTMAQPVDQLGQQAAELALALAAGEAPRRRTITVPTSLVLRSTTGRPGQA